MNDRELLELAAKAAGLRNPQYGQSVAGNWNIYHGDVNDPRECWNPLTDDGDALRLAMDLELGVVCKRGSDQYERNTSVVTNPYCVKQIRVTEKHKEDPHAATRRAIVRAAAEIGRAMA